MSMKILAIDTSTEACSVALYLDGALQERMVLGQQHSTRLLAMVDGLLDEAGMGLTQLDGLAFGRGPGGFTGLRIGAGVVQGLAFGADLPVAPISSLAALAQAQSQTHTRIMSALDARMGQVYWGMFRRAADGRVRAEGVEQVLRPDAVPLPEGQDWWGVGSGFDVYRATIEQRLGTRLAGVTPGQYPSARQVAMLGAEELVAGRGVSAELALPVYVRDEVAHRADR